jgi:hypothetical protein
MCPFCVANLARIAAGVVSTGGTVALVAKKISATMARRKTRRSFSSKAGRISQMSANSQQRAVSS